jgi:hypothetical protein
MVTSGCATWRVAPMLAAGVAVLGILALYWPTAASIIAIWIRSETFTHGFVIVPICLWLAWRRRDAPSPRRRPPSWPALGAVLAAGALWFLASVGDVVSARQFALVFIVRRRSSLSSGLASRALRSFRSPSCCSPCPSAKYSSRP